MKNVNYIQIKNKLEPITNEKICLTHLRSNLRNNMFVKNYYKNQNQFGIKG